MNSMTNQDEISSEAKRVKEYLAVISSVVNGFESKSSTYLDAVSLVFKRHKLRDAHIDELVRASDILSTYAFAKHIETQALDPRDIVACYRASKLLNVATYKKLECAEILQLYTDLVNISKMVPENNQFEACLLDAERGSAYCELEANNFHTID